MDNHGNNLSCSGAQKIEEITPQGYFIFSTYIDPYMVKINDITEEHPQFNQFASTREGCKFISYSSIIQFENTIVTFVENSIKSTYC